MAEAEFPSGIENEVAVIEGNTFMVSNELGDVMQDNPHGLFYADTRFLSQFMVTLNGHRPRLLQSDNVRSFAASFYTTNPEMDSVHERSLTITRDRFLGNGLHEDVTLENHAERDIHATVSVKMAADFADVFEVRANQVLKAGTITMREEPGYHLAFTYQRDSFRRQTYVRFSKAPKLLGNDSVFDVTLSPGERWSICIEVSPVVDDEPVGPTITHGQFEIPERETETARMMGAAIKAPQLVTDDHALFYTYDRAVQDLGALRLKTEGSYFLPAAGVPWFLAIFGRDSVLTAYQTLLLGSELARGALYALAHYQGKALNDFRDEEPGKIPHEVRRGELATLGEIPHATYYGSADATPLYLVLLSEYYRWTGDLDTVRDLLPAAEAALRWIDKYGDLDGDGFVEYRRRSSRGLINQGWKDSPDSVRFANGRLAKPPIALVEVQGYVYDAKSRMADIYELFGESERALLLRSEARDLKKRFNQAFWMPKQGFFALALDARKRQADAITSNPGHCLWSGIVDEDKAERVARRLMADDMYSGWGMRTLSNKMRGYNPISYHNGSVWPHDNSFIAAGLARYGFHTEAATVIAGMLTAADHFPHHRLPELFSGYYRRPFGFPVRYPGANAPQAWSSGAVILMLQTLLGAVPSNGLTVDALPNVPHIDLRGVSFRDQLKSLVHPPQ